MNPLWAEEKGCITTLLQIIPTGVGNVLLPDSKMYIRAVHPHGCGDILIVHLIRHLFFDLITYK